MFEHLFAALIRHVVVPAGAIWLLSNSFLGPQVAFLGVALVLTLLTAVMFMWQLLQIVPTIALIRRKHLMRLVTNMVVEITAVVGFWVVYVIQFV